MSPFSKSVVLDNNCLSNFFIADSLRKTLTLWPPGTFKIPHRVYTEASKWREHGAEVCQVITELEEAHIIELVSINDSSQEELDIYISLRLSEPFLGEGESESITVSICRDYIVATDDGIAKEHCNREYPALEVISTAAILNMAVKDKLLTKSKVNRIWKTIRTVENAINKRLRGI